MFRVLSEIEASLAARTEAHPDRPAETVAGRELALLLFCAACEPPAEATLLPVVFCRALTPAPTSGDLQAVAVELERVRSRIAAIDASLAGAEGNGRSRFWSRLAGTRDRRTLLDERAELVRAEELWVAAERRVLLRRLLAGLEDAPADALQVALAGLHDRRLVSHVYAGARWEQTRITCPPLVREYFAARWEGLDPQTFHAVRRRLAAVYAAA